MSDETDRIHKLEGALVEIRGHVVDQETVAEPARVMDVIDEALSDATARRADIGRSVGDYVVGYLQSEGHIAIDDEHCRCGWHVDDTISGQTSYQYHLVNVAGGRLWASAHG